jgi:hypothetical protein
MIDARLVINYQDVVYSPEKCDEARYIAVRLPYNNDC